MNAQQLAEGLLEKAKLRVVDAHEDLKHQKALFSELQKSVSSSKSTQWTERQRQTFESSIEKRQREVARAKAEVERAELELRSLTLLQQDAVRQAALAAKKAAEAEQIAATRNASTLQQTSPAAVNPKAAAAQAEQEKKYSAAVFESFAEASEKHNKEMLDFENQLLAQMQNVKIRKGKLSQDEQERQKQAQERPRGNVSPYLTASKKPTIPTAAERRVIQRPSSATNSSRPKSPSIQTQKIQAVTNQSALQKEENLNPATAPVIRNPKAESKIEQERHRLSKELSMLNSKSNSRSRSVTSTD